MNKSKKNIYLAKLKIKFLSLKVVVGKVPDSNLLFLLTFRELLVAISSRVFINDTDMSSTCWSDI